MRLSGPKTSDNVLIIVIGIRYKKILDEKIPFKLITNEINSVYTVIKGRM